jgi:trehalose-6-phosphate synthase
MLPLLRRPWRQTKLFDKSESYKQYVAVNQRVAYAHSSSFIYKEGDIIRVNDYHLILPPNLLSMNKL